MHTLKEYTFREQEITDVNKGLKAGKQENIPRRLRGTTFELVARMQRLHKRCSYHALLKYYCPVSVSFVAPAPTRGRKLMSFV